ncbi:MAG: NADH-quinone oxidoreductase subunit H [Elusimicrobia bacterium]|nr:NADH-quinone oxidoreductase subunit H [Elusimicrobiota bacterium]
MTLWILAKVAFALGLGLGLAGFLGWVERKQSAVLQDRVGANRASIFGIRLLGLFHPIADALKMLTKEDFVPRNARRVLHTAAPAISLGFALLCLAAFPYGGAVEFAGKAWSLQPVESPAGLVLVLALLSLGVHGIVMAGYASGSNYGLLGGLRGAAQMISYEVCLASSVAGVAFIYGSLDLQEACLWQGRLLGGWLPAWGIFLQPVGFLLFLTAGAAVTKRTPFDLPEGEAEIVGYHVEYSGMKFGMFLMTDFVESIVISALAVTLFLGGWQIPFVAPAGPWGGAAMVASFTAKLMLVLFFLMQVRWTLPRLRFDQLLDLSWKNILPLSLLNFIATVWGVYFLKGGRLWR